MVGRVYTSAELDGAGDAPMLSRCGFICLTDFDTRTAVYIQASHVISVTTATSGPSKGQATCVRTTACVGNVVETPEQVMALIAGVHHG